MKQPKTYMVNYWHDSSTNGTSCLWRGQSKAEWIKQAKKAIEKYHARASRCRVVDHPDRVVFSIASEKAYRIWLESTIFPPATATTGIPREVSE